MTSRRELNRRTLMKKTALLGASAGLGLAPAAKPVSASSAKRKAAAFALVGDRFHNSDYIRSALGKTLVRNAGLSIDFTDEVTLLGADTLKGYRLLIVFRDAVIWPAGYGKDAWWPGYQTRDPEVEPVGYVASNAGPPYKKVPPLRTVSVPPLPEHDVKAVAWMTEAQGLAVKQFVERGGSVFFYHNATYIASANGHFRDVLGAGTRDHPPIRPYKVTIVDGNHPITQGVHDFVVTDEQHFVAYDKAPKHVLMRSINQHGLTHKDHGTSSEAGWAYDYGKGRVCYMAPGHTIPALWNPEYEKLQKNAVRWLLRET